MQLLQPGLKHHQLRMADAGTGLVTLFSTLMQCGIIQMCVLPMYEDLKDRNPRRFQRAVMIAFSVF